MATTDSDDRRPLSPHLWHWRWHLSMLTSILHRITGVALAVGMIFLAAWFVSAAMGPDSYAAFRDMAAHPVGLVILFGFTWATAYHLLSGIRHLYWDAGIGYGPRTVHMTSLLVILGSVVLTGLIWAAAWYYRGGVS